MNTTKNNKIIVEFLGYTQPHPDYPTTTYWYKKDKQPLVYLSFHSDWNWLMEVVKEIEGLDGHLHICDNDVFIHFPKRIKDCIRIDGERLKLTKKEAVYNACVEFIKWYNTQQK